MVFGAYFDGESSKDENQYLQGWMEIPFPSCLEELGCFSFLLISAVGVLYLMPESLLRRPYSGALSLFLKILFYRDGKPKERSRSESRTVGNSASTT